MTTSHNIYEKATGFAFSAKYKGKNTVFSIAPSEDRFVVLIDDEIVGHIKIGYERHTWFVEKSQYFDYELVKEIGERIKAEFYKEIAS